LHGMSSLSDDSIQYEDQRRVVGDVRDPKIWDSVLDGIDIIFHQAAAVGMGQNMYEIAKYVEANSMATARMLEYLARHEHDVGELVVASSMSIYGEGNYKCEQCGPTQPGLRSKKNLAKSLWDPKCPDCGAELHTLPTNEEKALNPAFIYATAKRDQE